MNVSFEISGDTALDSGSSFVVSISINMPLYHPALPDLSFSF